MKAQKNNGAAMIYIGLSVFGGILCLIGGAAANRFQTGEIFLLAIGGIIAGAALGAAVNGIIDALKNK